MANTKILKPSRKPAAATAEKLEAVKKQKETEGLKPSGVVNQEATEEEVATVDNVNLKNQVINLVNGVAGYVETKEEAEAAKKAKAKAVTDSLIPIKGISSKMKQSLSRLGVYDIPSLLAHGKTQVRRSNLAAKLGIDVRYVNSWVKQANLWRAEGMDTDLAWMLVQVGIRSVEDLALVDIDKIYPVLRSLAETQPEMTLVSCFELQKIQESAKEIVDIASSSVTKISSDYGFESSGIESFYTESTDESSIEAQKLSAAWKDLFEYDCVLPLPKSVSGTIMQQSISASGSKPVPMAGVTVEIEGFAGPTADNAEKSKAPSCVTDASGHFKICFPEQYSFKENVKLIVSNGKGRQEFSMNASEVINSVGESALVDALQEILALRISYRSDASGKQDFVSAVDNLVKGGCAPMLKTMGIAAEVESLKSIPITGDDDLFDSTLCTIFLMVLKKSSLEAKLAGTSPIDKPEYFLVTTEVFTGDRTDLKKALPSVRLMGNDDNQTMLSTDTAPSKMYSYSMLQRLIEPKVRSRKDSNSKWGDVLRKEVSEPIDIAGFKDEMTENPDNYAQMASLGLGYQLNMHQAWVPDGFALGDLLYSLILAPGEEQRLIVREKKQSYELTDTSEGTDNVSDEYAATQTDDTSAVYNYAVDQLMKANSSYETESHSWGAGGSGGGFFSGGAFGLSASYSGATASGASSASQSNSHNEASAAAQQFQQSIKSASNKLSQAKRVSVSVASSDVSDSVATKIIANHNHSHAMTIQYWEVMRRYKLETSVDSVELVLFVPLKVVRFLPDGQKTPLSLTTDKSFDISAFNQRYKEILKHANVLESALPYKYRTGLRLMRQFAAIPNWTYEEKLTTSPYLKLTFNSNMLSFDQFTAEVILKNGKGRIAGTVNHSDYRTISDRFSTRQDLKNGIRNRTSDSLLTEICTCLFPMPSTVIPEDISYIRITHTCDSFSYDLYRDESKLTANQLKAWKHYVGKEEDFAQDNDNSDGDVESMKHYAELLPEAFKNQHVTFTAAEMAAMGAPSIDYPRLTYGTETIQVQCGESVIDSSIRLSVEVEKKTLRCNELQKMEEMFQHVVNDSLKYSQAVWASLSSDERAMLFEKYTVNMDYSKLRAGTANDGNADADTGVNVPLLNCVNVRKMLGFYGNCMLFPFTFPQELEARLGRSAADVQDQLYRFHTNSFRAPTTIISMPTSGMIGEAVLGQTNVSEEIDLTRFWNWQDSPIDKMSVDNQYLDSTDYLSGKETKGISALNLQSAAAPSATTFNDLITALANKKTPDFKDITGQEQLSSLVTKALENSGNGRDKIIEQTASITNKGLELAQQLELAKLKSGKSEAEGTEQDGTEQNGNEQNSGEQGGGTNTGTTPGGTTGQNGKKQQNGGTKSNSQNGQNGSTGGSGQSAGTGGGVGQTNITINNGAGSSEFSDIMTKLKEYFTGNDTPSKEDFLEHLYELLGGSSETKSEVNENDKNNKNNKNIEKDEKDKDIEKDEKDKNIEKDEKNVNKVNKDNRSRILI